MRHFQPEHARIPYAVLALARLDLVERHHATLLHVVPPVVVALAKHPSVEHRDFSSIRKPFWGAAPLGANAIEQCTRRIHCVRQQGYGLTETSPATHATSDDPAQIKYGSIGQPLPNTECRIMDLATGRDVASGHDGEIWLRGPQVMRGYLNRHDETRATIDDEGWLHTGDVGHADEDGHFFIVDRLKELIKYKGMQVPPAELEAVLLSHPAVADATVVSLKDDEAGETPGAFVVLKAPASADELMAYVAQRVGPIRKSGVWISSAPSRNPLGARSSGGCSGISRSRERGCAPVTRRSIAPSFSSAARGVVSFSEENDYEAVVVGSGRVRGGWPGGVRGTEPAVAASAERRSVPQ